MSRPIVSLTTVFSFALHMVLGCCVLHPHATETTVCEHHAVAADSISHPGHDHQASLSSQESPSDSPFPEGHCTASKCVFLSLGNLDLVNLTTVAQLPIPANEAIGTLVSYSTITYRDTGVDMKPPTRLHLFHQVMLI